MAGLGDVFIASILFFGIHFGIAGSPLRGILVGRIGEIAFQGFFSVLSLIVLVWAVMAYGAAPAVVLWDMPALQFVPHIVMPFAAILVVCAYTTANPTGVGGDKALHRERGPKGIVGITRHPLLVGIALWAGAHMIVNGDAASLAFFGGFLLTALVGTVSIDAKLKAREPEAFDRLAAVTSIIPFAAVMQGRARIRWSEISWWRPAVGIALYAALYLGHPYIAGVSLH